MTSPDFSQAIWRKSSRSGDNGGQCVEIAFGDRAVGVRDSKDKSGPVLVFTRREWAAFLTTTRTETFRHRDS
jgi:hypothetical protein